MYKLWEQKRNTLQLNFKCLVLLDSKNKHDPMILKCVSNYSSMDVGIKSFKI